MSRAPTARSRVPTRGSWAGSPIQREPSCVGAAKKVAPKAARPSDAIRARLETTLMRARYPRGAVNMLDR